MVKILSHSGEDKVEGILTWYMLPEIINRWKILGICFPISWTSGFYKESSEDAKRGRRLGVAVWRNSNLLEQMYSEQFVLSEWNKNKSRHSSNQAFFCKTTE